MDTTIALQANTELRERFVTLLSALSGLSSMVTLPVETRDEKFLIEHVLDILVSHHDMENCSVFLLSGQTLSCASGRSGADLAGTSDPLDTPEAMQFAIGEGMIGRCAESGEVQYSEDVSKDAHFSARRRQDGTAQTGSLICVPISSGFEILGVLNVSHPQTGFFHPWYQNVLANFGKTLGQLIEYNRLLENMETAVAERNRQLEKALNEAEALRIRYEQLALTDDLTQLYTRRFFFTETQAALARALRNRHPFILMLLNVDEMKSINDEFGFTMGDEVLREVALILQRHTRDGDILARFGGDEFVLAMDNTSADDAALLAARIQHTINTHRWSDKHDTLCITAGIGIGYLDNFDLDAELALTQLLHQAGESLTTSKSLGKNQHIVHPAQRIA